MIGRHTINSYWLLLLVAVLEYKPSSLSIFTIYCTTKAKEARKAHVIRIKITSTPKYSLVVHWDGKILPLVVGYGKVATFCIRVGR